MRLLLNGRALGTQPVQQGVARFRVPFGAGLNQLRAEAPGQPLSDQIDIDFQLVPTPLASERLPFRELNVSLGDARTFTDELLQQVWLPEQPYQPGGWGYVGGEAYKLPGTGRLPYGSDRNILGTDYDALYQTQRAGLQQFRADVPAGEYEVTLHFAELEAVPAGEQLVYNLGAATSAPAAATAAGRSFAVRLNGQLVLPRLSAATGLQPLRGSSFRFPVSVRGPQGLVVDFEPQTGRPVLNGIQIRRVW
ncbi:hypothetical protein EJV47_17005 [Hymenobacter gummosus]|uniref:Malectin domain-containing protein n=1 Tax=Hymenobacter gummosus TaxID=1776032 RepID=A0A3S0H3M3_9BACT|nr:malectin domain-containing carbohydrate-binding protein [Hymenobacter gummosus]RTQ48134.1 hypothetical protein EJV47_17005 [Hymenobacter gummosus]